MVVDPRYLCGLHSVEFYTTVLASFYLESA